VLAAILHGPRDLRYEDVPTPEPGPGDVQVRVAHNGICGSDLHSFYGGPSDDRPRILGHELSGVITEVGDGVDDLATGTRVVVRPTWGCTVCPHCAAGVPHLCPDRISFSTNPLMVGTGGSSAPAYTTSHGAGLSEFVVVPRQCIVPLADGLDLGQGALTEPMAVAYNGLLRAGAAPGKSALVIGGGPIGIGAFLGLTAMGVEQIIVSEPSGERRVALEALGAATVLDPTAVDVPRVVRELTGGLGADAVVEAAGTPRSFASALDSCAPHGRISLIAIFEEQPQITPLDLIVRELDLVGAIGYNRTTFEQVHDLIAAGHYPTEGWVEHVDYDDLVPAIEELRGGTRMKLLVDLPS
jgi:(R,R)-butanediol dehydrogenase/meso-butanediol dehydrogenase/diacetyl reductase